MTVYEMIQELSQHDANAEINICVEGTVEGEVAINNNGGYEREVEVALGIEQTTTSIDGTYERNGKIYFDVMLGGANG